MKCVFPETKSGIAIQHVNRKGKTYYLHHRRSKTGASQYYFTTKPKGGGSVEEIPEGYEIYEKISGQVFLRRKKPRLISGDELTTLRQVLDRQPHRPFYLLEEEDATITVYHAEEYRGFGDDLLYRPLLRSPEEVRQLRAKFLNYTAVMRFVLSGPDPRLFAVERYCFRGSVERWIPLAGPGRLEAMAEEFLPHIGRDSFFELTQYGRIA